MDNTPKQREITRALNDLPLQAPETLEKRVKYLKIFTEWEQHMKGIKRRLKWYSLPLLLTGLAALITGFTTSAIIAFGLSGIVFLSQVLYWALTIDSYNDEKHNILFAQSRVTNPLTSLLSQHLEHHNRITSTVYQTFKLRQEMPTSESDEKFLDLIAKIITVLETNKATLNKMMEKYVRLKDIPATILEDFGKVIAQDLTMNGDLCESFETELTQLKIRTETELSTPAMAEVLNLRQILAPVPIES